VDSRFRGNDLTFEGWQDSDFLSPSEAWGEEDRRPTVSTGGDELQFTRAVSAMIDRAPGFEYTRSDGLGERVRVSLRDIADLKERGVRQPASLDSVAPTFRSAEAGWRRPRLLGLAMPRRHTLGRAAQSGRSIRRTDASSRK
jgi:hypothetical protein